MDSITLALSAMLGGVILACTFIWGYYSGRKDQTPNNRRAMREEEVHIRGEAPKELF